MEQLALFAMPRSYIEKGDADSGSAAAPRGDSKSGGLSIGDSNGLTSDDVEDLIHYQEVLEELLSEGYVSEHFKHRPSFPTFSMWLPTRDFVRLVPLDLNTISQKMATGTYLTARNFQLDIVLMFAMHRMVRTNETDVYNDSKIGNLFDTGWHVKLSKERFSSIVREVENKMRWVFFNARNLPFKLLDDQTTQKIELVAKNGDQWVVLFPKKYGVPALYAYVECRELLGDLGGVPFVGDPGPYQNAYYFKLSSNLSLLPREILDINSGLTVEDVFRDSVSSKIYVEHLGDAELPIQKDGAYYLEKSTTSHTPSHTALTTEVSSIESELLASNGLSRNDRGQYEHQVDEPASKSVLSRHKVGANPKSGSTHSGLAFERLSDSAETFISLLNVVSSPPYLRTQPSGHILKAAQDCLTAGQDLLQITKIIWDNCEQVYFTGYSLEVSRVTMDGAIFKLGEAFSTHFSTVGDKSQSHSHSSVIVVADLASECIEAARQCLEEARKTVDLIGDFEIDSDSPGSDVTASLPYLKVDSDVRQIKHNSASDSESSQWIENRVLSWLSENHFSKEWENSFRTFGIYEDNFFDLSKTSEFATTDLQLATSVESELKTQIYPRGDYSNPSEEVTGEITRLRDLISRISKGKGVSAGLVAGDNAPEAEQSPAKQKEAAMGLSETFGIDRMAGLPRFELLPVHFMRLLEKKMQGILLGREQEPEYHDPVFKRIVAMALSLNLIFKSKS